MTCRGQDAFSKKSLERGCQLLVHAKEEGFKHTDHAEFTTSPALRLYVPAWQHISQRPRALYVKGAGHRTVALH